MISFLFYLFWEPYKLLARNVQIHLELSSFYFPTTPLLFYSPQYCRTGNVDLGWFCFSLFFVHENQYCLYSEWSVWFLFCIDWALHSRLCQIAPFLPNLWCSRRGTNHSKMVLSIKIQKVLLWPCSSLIR